MHQNGVHGAKLAIKAATREYHLFSGSFQLYLLHLSICIFKGIMAFPVLFFTIRYTLAIIQESY
jgi:hypothetical protein